LTPLLLLLLLCCSRGLATIMGPVMLSDVLFLLMEHRAEYLLQKQMQVR
jgi:hypothetical protein